MKCDRCNLPILSDSLGRPYCGCTPSRSCAHREWEPVCFLTPEGCPTCLHEAKVRALVQTVRGVEERLDRANGASCNHCGSRNYVADVGLRHRADCLIVKLHAALVPFEAL